MCSLEESCIAAKPTSGRGAAHPPEGVRIHDGVDRVCDAGDMPELGLAERAFSSRSRPDAARAWLSSLTADPRARHVLGVVSLAVLYRGVAEIGYALQFAGPVAAIVWLPVGVGIAFLYVGGLRYWPGVLIGDLLANDYAALPLGSALGQTSGNVLEILAATLLLRKLVPGGDPLASVGDLARMLVAIGVGTAVSATIGSLSLLLGGVIAADALQGVWRTWWLGDASGALIVLPLALAWAQLPSRSWWRWRAPEVAAMLVFLVAVSELALHAERPLTYLTFPALIWAGLRLGRRGATLAVAVAAGFAIWETTRQVGPFAYESMADSVLSTQLFLAVSALSTLSLAVVVAEREAFAASLAASRARLVETADNERRRIERNLHDGAQQRLTALRVQLAIGAEQSRVAPERAPGILDAAGEELSESIDELRELAHGIHPSTLTADGLAQALRTVAARSVIPIRLIELPADRVDETAESTAYFVFCEAVANTRKHAEATSIQVFAATSRRHLRIEITDDGRGGAAVRKGSGLEGLRDRVEAIGGRLEIDSPVGNGTRLFAIVPATPTAS
jgi:signal transduction histidine kinase